MPIEKAYIDPILDELHAIRREMLAECGGSLEELGDELQRCEVASGRVFMTPQQDQPAAAQQREAEATEQAPDGVAEA
ncbi:MAG: hypothetical protein H0T51_16995 [Pirellulales bacterium]|nr:hypothetical protein [Pirellulales bacterium]